MGHCFKHNRKLWQSYIKDFDRTVVKNSYYRSLDEILHMEKVVKRSREKKSIAVIIIFLLIHIQEKLVMSENTLARLLRGPQSAGTREIETIIQNVMIGGYADFEIACDDIMDVVADIETREGNEVAKKLIRMAKNREQTVSVKVTRPDVKAYIQRKLRASPVGAQVQQVEAAARLMEQYGQMQRENMTLLLSLTKKQTNLIRDMNEITEELDEKEKEKLASDIEQISTGNALIQPRPQQQGVAAAVANPPLPPPPEEAEEGGEEAMEAEGNEAEIEAREIGGAAAAAAGEAPAEPMTEEARKAEFVAKKMERILELEKQIVIVTKRQKFCAGQIEKNLRIVQNKKAIFK